jgi:hypothetical protein
VADVAEERSLRLDEPVVVLTCARSGSTLLRFLLDAHPALACPPETGVVDLVTRMGVLSMLLDGPPEDGQAGLSDHAAEAICAWVGSTFGAYLQQAGKVRWCEKSLGSADSAGRFLALFPKAKFICLYRHCLDVVDSMMEACPWGLRGYGLEPFAAAHPGNSVAAITDFWVTHTRAIAEFEAVYPEACLRVRYEDVTANPEEQAERIFRFIGEQPLPGISAACLAERGPEHFGPADHKIWWTTGINTDSVGRGWRIPVEALSQPVLALANDLLSRLGYDTIDEGPGRHARMAGPGVSRAPADDVGLPASQDHTTPDNEAAVLDQLDELLTARVATRPAGGELADTGVSSAFFITGTVPVPGGDVASRSWRVDPEAGRIARAGAVGSPGEWGVIGSVEAWRCVLAGQLNFGTAMRHGQLRYTDAPADEVQPLPPLRGDSRTRVLTAALAH